MYKNALLVDVEKWEIWGLCNPMARYLFVKQLLKNEK
jgi:hypothetical protein